MHRFPRRSSARPHARLALGLIAAALLVLPKPAPTSAAVVAVASSPVAPPDDPTTGAGSLGEAAVGVEPSAMYLDAMAHANDRIDFEPGARVRVPFRPRVGDGWSVDGGRPRSLPAGQVSGREMRNAASAGETSTSGDPAAAGWEIDSDVRQSAGVAPEAATLASVANNGLNRAVLGFLPYWEVSDSSTTLDYPTLSTIAYFSVGCASGGNLLKRNADGSLTTGWAGWTSSKLTSIIDHAHDVGTRVVLTLSCFGWSDGGKKRQKSILTSSSYRTNLAKQVAKAVHDRGADGVNLDFEPLVSGAEDGFVAFVRAVRSALAAYAPGYELTFDTMGYVGNYPIESATGSGAADALMIMGYDYRTGRSSSAGSISPLTGPHYDLNDTIAAYTKRISPSRIILGLPYYGRAWSTPTDDPHAENISGTKYGSSVNVTYTSALRFVADYGRRWDPIEQGPWTAYRKQTCTATYGCVTSWRELYYDDAQSLGLKYDLVNRAGLRGAGIWALGYDGTRPELHEMLAAKFRQDTTAPVTGIVSLATAQLDEGFTVAWKAYDDTDVASYDVQVSGDGSAWSAWLTGVTRTRDVYLGSSGHTYAFRVRATDSVGNVSPWYDVAVTGTGTPSSLEVGGFGRVRIDDLHMRSSPDTSATNMATLASGSIVLITGGPKQNDGYTWYRVNGPIRQWTPVDLVQRGGWVATSNGTRDYVVPRSMPHATHVAAGLQGYAVGGGGDRVLTPNGDGVDDTIRIHWTNAVALDSLALGLFSSDGSMVGSRSVARLAAGAQTFDWDGTLGGVPVGSGDYVAQLVGVRGTTTYRAPSASPITATQLLTFGIAVAAIPPTEVFSFKPTTPNPTRYGTIRYSLVFGGSVTGLRAGDFVRTGSATGCDIGSPSGSGKSYTITVSGCSAGTVKLAVRADAVTDGVGNSGPEVATAAPRVLIDKTAPTTSAPHAGLRSGWTYSGSPLAGRLTWSGADSGGAGIASYDVERSIDGAAFSVIATGVSRPWLNVNLATGHTYRFAVRARDSAGNVGAWHAGGTMSLVIREATSGALRYSTGWHTATGPSYSGGSVRYAKAAGASVRLSFTGRSIAFVTTTGPGRGQVKVYLDGAYLRTLDLFSASVGYRQVLWSRTWPSAGDHVLRLVVVGTVDRPRVDVDALLVLR